MQADAFTEKHKLETKFNYALKRVQDQVKKHGEHLQVQLMDIEIELCVVDGNDVIQRDAQGNLQFTRKNIRERNKQQRVLFEQEFEVEPYYASEVPSDLTSQQIDAFTGLVIKEANSEEVPETDNVDVQLGA